MAKTKMTREELDKQIADNMHVGALKTTGNIAAGTVQAVSDGALFAGGVIGMSAATDYAVAHMASTESRKAVQGSLHGTQTVKDTAKFAEELGNTGLKHLDGTAKGAWKTIQHYALENKTTMKWIGALTAASAIIYSVVNIKNSRDANDARIGEAYRMQLKLDDAQPALAAPGNGEKPIVGTHTAQLAQERAARGPAQIG